MVRLAGYESLSTVDWIPNLSMVLFFAGCNMRCRFCYNHEYILMDSGTEYTLREVYDIIEENEGIFDCVVITGGEPTLQYDELRKICEFLQDKQYPVMLDTNGIEDGLILKLAFDGLIDRVAIDVKANLYEWLDWKRQCSIDKINFMRIKSSIFILSRMPSIYLELRTTVVPYTATDPAFMKDIIDSIVDFTYCDEYHLQQFDSSNPLDESLKDIETVSVETLRELGQYAKDRGINRVLIKSKDGIEVLT